MSCRFANHVIIANDIWRAKLIRRSVAAADCTTVLNYPDLRLFSPAPTRRAHDDKFVMLYPGSLNHHQGVHTAVLALARIRDRVPHAELHVYGEGPAHSSLYELTEKLGLQRRVHLHDPVPLEEIARTMAAADLGIEPKLADGFSGDAVSTKILEFMAVGVPVIVSRTAAHAYYFDETVLRFFPAGDDVALAEAIVEFHEHRFEQADLIARAREFAVSYGWQRRVNDYLTLVDALLARSRRGVSISYRSASIR